MNEFKPNDNPMTRIQEGMEVFDTHGDKVGSVRTVKFGDEDPDTPKVEAVQGFPADQRHDNLIMHIAEALAGMPDIPEEVQARLLRYGYIQIDRGLMQSDAVASGEQIASITDDTIYLNAAEDMLLTL